MSFQFNFSVEESEDSPEKCCGPLNVLLDNKVKRKLANEKEEKSIEVDCSCNKGDDILSGCIAHKDCKAEENTAGCKPAVEHKIPQDVTKALENKIIEKSSDLQFINVSVVEMILSNEDSHDERIVSKTITAKSDLISGVYEGGMKIWECTFDLLRYFEEEDFSFEGKTILDLGCGAGLLGILALKRKAKEVHFQDYNSTVIEEITIANALVNCDSGDVNEADVEPSGKRLKKSDMKAGLLSKCRFFSGEWSTFTQFMQDQMPPVRYDIILTSETIYNTDYYSALHKLFQHLLSSNGVVYLASKSHYFGVGGGVHLFETFVKEAGLFHVNTVKTYDDGLQRMLLSLSFKP